MQEPPEQVRLVVLQALPAQHGWPLPPHALQLPELQIVAVAVHTLPVQQGWLLPPHAAQVPPEQIAPAPQVVPQQGCPAPPHETQLPDEAQTVPVPHDWPLQQGSFAAPQATQVDVPDEHRNPVAQVEFGQHGWPLPPQLPQVPFMQATLLPVHEPPAQQTCPTPPHVAHLPADVQMRLLELQLEPQQGWLAPPHATQLPPEQV